MLKKLTTTPMMILSQGQTMPTNITSTSTSMNSETRKRRRRTRRTSTTTTTTITTTTMVPTLTTTTLAGILATPLLTEKRIAEKEKESILTQLSETVGSALTAKPPSKRITMEVEISSATLILTWLASTLATTSMATLRNALVRNITVTGKSDVIRVSLLPSLVDARLLRLA